MAPAHGGEIMQGDSAGRPRSWELAAPSLGARGGQGRGVGSGERVGARVARRRPRLVAAVD